MVGSYSRQLAPWACQQASKQISFLATLHCTLKLILQAVNKQIRLMEAKSKCFGEKNLWQSFIIIICFNKENNTTESKNGIVWKKYNYRGKTGVHPFILHVHFNPVKGIH
jgi:hypothetical protein